jgi:hypothetical protein
MAAFEVLALDTATPQIRAPGAADTYTFPRAITPSGANVTPFTVSGYSLTGANAQSLIDMSGTWNTTGTPTGIKLNVTDTASNAASLLLDLQVGGSSRFSIAKGGAAVFTNTITLGNFAVDGTGNRFSVGGSFCISNAGTSGPAIYNNGYLGWLTGSASLNSPVSDLTLYRDAANTLAQRNGVNAQTLRVYNTFTDASNYERGVFSWSSNILTIGTQNAGTGLGRAVQFVMGGTSIFYISPGGALLWNTDNSFDIGSSGANRPRNLILGSYQEMSEMTAPAAPAANSVRIYAVDNGSGKTQLMALFATGAAQQIAIEP